MIVPALAQRFLEGIELRVLEALEIVVAEARLDELRQDDVEEFVPIVAMDRRRQRRHLISRSREDVAREPHQRASEAGQRVAATEHHVHRRRVRVAPQLLHRGGLEQRHRAGVEAVRASVDTGARLGLGALTLYAFSTENWKRPRYEVDALMRMLRKYLRLELDEINRQNIRFQTIGRIAALAPRVQDEIARATDHTASNTGMILSVALNYGGRAEIVDAVRAASVQTPGRTGG